MTEKLKKTTQNKTHLATKELDTFNIIKSRTTAPFTNLVHKIFCCFLPIGSNTVFHSQKND